MVGSVSDHSRIGRALEMTFHLFSADLFCLILGGHFAWQAQYLVRLEGVAVFGEVGGLCCCSAHCK